MSMISQASSIIVFSSRSIDCICSHPALTRFTALCSASLAAMSRLLLLLMQSAVAQLVHQWTSQRGGSSYDYARVLQAQSDRAFRWLFLGRFAVGSDRADVPCMMYVEFSSQPGHIVMFAESELFEWPPLNSIPRLVAAEKAK